MVNFIITFCSSCIINLEFSIPFYFAVRKLYFLLVDNDAVILVSHNFHIEFKN